MPLRDLIPLLQIAVGPVILVSGVGLLLLSMTNRFGRVIDRTRQLTHELRNASPQHRAVVLAQLRILLKRASIIRAAITFAALSLLLVAVLIIVLFISAVWELALALAIIGLFVACMACLISSLIFFLRDINVSLTALRLEVGDPDIGGAEPRVAADSLPLAAERDIARP